LKDKARDKTGQLGTFQDIAREKRGNPNRFLHIDGMRADTALILLDVRNFLQLSPTPTLYNSAVPVVGALISGFDSLNRQD
jgi:hypothetical protein